MKHIIIQIDSIMLFPPTLSLMQCLRRRGDDVVAISSCASKTLVDICEDYQIHLIVTGSKYDGHDTPPKKLLSILSMRRGIRHEIKSLYTDDSMIWIMGTSPKCLGDWIYDKKYIMYMFELSEECRYYYKFPIPKVNLKKMFDNASAITECEYNRAHILKAWFGLKDLPYIIPNKPLMEQRMKCRLFVNDAYARKKIEIYADKKIILYQGIIGKERPLKPFIDAVQMLDDTYVLVVMSSDINEIAEYESERVCLIPYINPPQHLEVTSWAHIGILIYCSETDSAVSPLNSIYCAPNKLYEYSMFGIPMIGNDIPGLKYTIEYNNMGKCFKSLEPNEIVQSIKEIEQNYSTYHENSKRFYEQTDTEKNINKVVDDLQGKC